MATVSQVFSQAFADSQILSTIISPVNSNETSGETAGGVLQLTQSLNQKTSDPLVEKDKQAIYRHPLFPLMALLFEKCEQASQTAECPTSESFDVDIQSFVRHQKQEGKQFFSEDQDLNAVMVKAIQVLRIHLLELEKVNELCMDFCQRYTTCLKGKLQSENLLRTESDYDDSMFEVPPQSTAESPNGGMVLGSGIGNQNVIIQSGFQQTQVPALGPGQIMSGGTVYQMVQTPQGLVAQPLQIQPNTIGTPSIIHGSTPLSQIGPTTPPISVQSNLTSALGGATSMDSDDEDVHGKKKNKRGVLPKSATQVMKSWLFQHIVHPYPTEDEKRTIATQTNLTLLQVNNWFINARRRILQPMLDASNPEQTKAKKTKPASRPPQRFWPFTSTGTTESQSSSSSPGETITSTLPTSISTGSNSTIILPPGTYVTADGQILGLQGTSVNLQGTSVTEMLNRVSQASPGSDKDSSDNNNSDNNNNSHNTDCDDTSKECALDLT